MISNAIVDMLANSDLGLTKGVDLFAENGSGDKYVVVSVTNDYGAIEQDSSVRMAYLGILLYGYTLSGGMILSRRIAEYLDGNNSYDYTLVESNYSSTYNDNIKYTIKSTAVTNFPNYISHNGSFSINILVGYATYAI